MNSPDTNIQKVANGVFRLLKVNSISYPIGRTEKGDLAIRYTKDKEGWEILLDSVPLNEKEIDNRELKAILMKYLYEPSTD